jgi:hypothetical protein
MAISRPTAWLRVVAVAAVLAALAAVAALLVGGSSRARLASGETAPDSARQAVTFSWLHPAPAPPGWLQTTTATSQATLFYPPGWKPIPGDKGTVTVSLRDHSGLYAGYLNVTPRQGAEQLHGWAAFRTTRNREDGDGQVSQAGAAEGLHFRGARGSCVIDDYLSKVGSHPYREIACIVGGLRHTDVFIGAALRSDWTALGGTLERAASSLLQR